jgi:hypothetical protein
MNKADKIVYGTPLMQASAETMKNYVLAFTIHCCPEKLLP